MLLTTNWCMTTTEDVNKYSYVYNHTVYYTIIISHTKSNYVMGKESE